MRKHLLAAGIAAATLIPTFALAQTAPCRTENNRMVGTVAGAGIGALAGSAVAGHGNKTEGAVLGGVLGAIVGNQVTKGSSDNCARAYGYYDANGRWHANAIDQASAQGYYDRNGNWVAGAPNGYYDNNGRWTTASSQRGYYDRSGYWVPPSTTGYYDINGRWVTPAPAVTGYNASYGNRDIWAGAPTDLRQREAWLERRIQRGQRDGSLTRQEAYQALRQLSNIRREEYRMSRNGLDSREQARVQARLDDLSQSIRWARHNGARDDDQDGNYQNRDDDRRRNY
jgi:hypothetical protein